LRSDPENSERFVLCSERIVLECKCGESLVLLGLEEDWQSEQIVFDCECGESLTLANRPAEEALAIKKLLRSDSELPALEPYAPSRLSTSEQHHDER
jgi:hypothetical protein